MYTTQEYYLNMGPQHPSTHGVLRLMLKMDGEEVVEAIPHIGYLHRGLEKIAEERLYHQFIPITDRLDYATSMSSNYVYVLAVEKLMAVKVPKRAEYIRVIMLELNRIASHLIWFGTLALDLGATTPFIYAFRERELILNLFEMTCGARLTYNYFRFGGVSHDINEEFVKKCGQFCAIMNKKFDEYDQLLTGNIIFQTRMKDRGILSKDNAVSFGVTGPNLRACGLRWDLRRDEAYSVYNELSFDIPVRQTGDCLARYEVRMEELRQSVKIIEQALNKLPSGSYKTTHPLMAAAPLGEIYSRIESPRGEIGCYIVSDGTDKPYRLKLRGPSFSNLSAIPHILKGARIPDVVAIVASFDIILPETDR